MTPKANKKDKGSRLCATISGPAGSLVPNVCVRTKCANMKCEDPIFLETWVFFHLRPANNPFIFMLFFDPIGTSWEGLEGIY